MIIQNELKRMREASNITMANLNLQTGLKNEHILNSEDTEKELDLAV